MFEIAGTIALVTGGISGIGLSVGKALLQNGLAGLAMADVDGINGKIVLQSVKEQYGHDKVIFIKLDVTDKKQFHDAFQHTISVFKNLDIVINSAVIVSVNSWERELTIGTATGTLLAIEKYLPTFKSDTEGVVLNVASIYGLENYSTAPIYSAAKTGIIGLSRSFGTKHHYEKNQVRIMVLCPGFTETPFLQYSTVTTTHTYPDMLEKDFPKLYIQNVNNVSQTMIQMIKEGKNGSIWVSEDDQPPYEIEFLKREELKK
ncbi:hypothetical protein FQR65_LT12718 [Abscondita terminalis]|nr:hypothetical protein FQR65_LT12718 [Abscondita terminalis]